MTEANPQEALPRKAAIEAMAKHHWNENYANSRGNLSWEETREDNREWCREYVSDHHLPYLEAALPLLKPQQAEETGRIGGYAPGTYYCTCSTCNQKFTGHKRAIQCLSCAKKQINDTIRSLPAVVEGGELDELRLHVAGFLSHFQPATDGNYTQPMSMVADKRIKAFADYIAGLPDTPKPESVAQPAEDAVERVAEAIFKSVYGNDIDYRYSEHKELYRRHAKAALAAMPQRQVDGVIKREYGGAKEAFERAAQICRYYFKHQNYVGENPEYESGVGNTCSNLSDALEKEALKLTQTEDQQTKEPVEQTPTIDEVTQRCLEAADLNGKFLLGMLESHIVDWPTAENISMQRKYLHALKAIQRPLDLETLERTFFKAYRNGTKGTLARDIRRRCRLGLNALVPLLK